MPEPGFGILVPRETRNAGDGDDQTVPVRSKPPGRNGEGLDPTALLPAVRRLADRLDTVGRTFGGADGFKGVVKRWLLALTWAIRKLPVSRAASKVFLTVNGVRGEYDTEQTEIFDHLLRCGDFIGLIVNFHVGQDQGGFPGKGGQSLYPLRTMARPGDVLISISSSGNSENIVRAVAWARDNGVGTIALTGFSGGRSADDADVNLHVDAANYGVVEDVHQSLIHVLAQYLRQKAMPPELVASRTF